MKMFSFHKPRVYRSTEGCCICRAKSSSSRFTDSRKYEDDSMKCFNLDKARHGEICNACVLLVKRYKRLPNESARHWGHVVDARSGPGTKSMTKINKKVKDEGNHYQETATSTEKTNKIIKSSTLVPEKFTKILKKNKKSLNKNKNLKKNCNNFDIIANSNLINKFATLSEQEKKIYLKPLIRLNKRKPLNPKRNLNPVDKISFTEIINWQVLKICCGMAYENQAINALIIDLENYKPNLCKTHNKLARTKNYNKNNNLAPGAAILNSCNKTIINYYTNTNINSPTALKKHHLYYKRQSENFPKNFPATNNIAGTIPSNYIKTDMNIHSQQHQKLQPQIQQQEPTKSTKNTILNKIKDSGKIVKNAINKIHTSTMSLNNKTMNSIEIKHLIKPILNNKKPEIMPTKLNNFKKIDPTSTKFSDNSSDSGFDENLDRKSESPTEVGDMIRPITMLLPNGVSIHGRPQNLILAGNEIAASLLESKMKK